MSLIRDLIVGDGLLSGRINPAENPDRRITGGLLVQLMNEFGIGLGIGTNTGKIVTPATGFRVIAVYRAITLIAGQIGSLPLKVTDDDKQEINVPIIDEPHPGMTSFEFRETLAGHLASWGNFDAFIVRDERNGEILELWPYTPGRVTYKRTKPTESNPSGRLYRIHDKNGEQQSVLTDNEVFHVPLFSLDGFVGMSPVGLAREAIASSLSAEEFANRLWKSGSLMSGFLTTPQRLNEEKARNLKTRWQERIAGVDKAHEIAILDNGAEFKTMSIPPNDAQFLEGRKFQVDEIARLYGLPPHLLSQQERQTSWGTGIEQNNIGFVVYTLDPIWLTRIEQRFERLIDANAKGWSVDFSVQALMRGDAATRAAFYQAMFGMGSLSSNEIRAFENLPPREGGDEYHIAAAESADPEEPADDDDDDNDDDE